MTPYGKVGVGAELCSSLDKGRREEMKEADLIHLRDQRWWDA